MYVWISTWLGKYLRKTHSEDNFCFLCDFLSISWRHPVDFCIWEGSAFFELEIYKYKFLPCKQILFDRLLLAGFLFFCRHRRFLLLCANARDFCLLWQLDFHGVKDEVRWMFRGETSTCPHRRWYLSAYWHWHIGVSKKKKKERKKRKKMIPLGPYQWLVNTHCEFILLFQAFLALNIATSFVYLQCLVYQNLNAVCYFGRRCVGK